MSSYNTVEMPAFQGFIKIGDSKFHASLYLPVAIAVVTFFTCQLSEQGTMKSNGQQG